MCIVLGGHWMRRDSPYIHVGHLRFGSSTSRYLIIKRNKEKGKLHLSVFRYRVGRRNVFQSGIYQYMLPGTYQSIIFYHMDTSQVQTYITSVGLLTEEISPMVQRTARQIPWLSTYLGAALSAHSPSLYIYDSVKARQLIIPLCNVHINHACSKVLYSKCLYEVPRQSICILNVILGSLVSETIYKVTATFPTCTVLTQHWDSFLVYRWK